MKSRCQCGLWLSVSVGSRRRGVKFEASGLELWSEDWSEYRVLIGGESEILPFDWVLVRISAFDWKLLDLLRLLIGGEQANLTF